MIRPDQFSTLCGNAKRAALYYPALVAALTEFHLDTPLRTAHLLAQLLHESQYFTATRENLNYTPAAILATFNNPRITRFTPTMAQQYGRTASHAASLEAIANIAYASRMGNGPAASGDGWAYRGGGSLQLTGADNYRNYGKALGIDLLHHPELITDPLVGLRVAGKYWNDHALSPLADADNLVAITRAINGGENGLPERKANLIKCKQVLGIA